MVAGKQAGMSVIIIRGLQNFAQKRYFEDQGEALLRRLRCSGEFDITKAADFPATT